MAQFLPPPEHVTEPVRGAQNLPAAGESGKLHGERCSLSEPSLPAGGDRPSAPFPDPPIL